MPASAELPIATVPPEKLYIFDTHPVQYRSPMFAALHRLLPGTKIYFFDESFDGKKWWFNEVNKIPPQKWELQLTSGFPNEFLEVAQTGLRRFAAKAREILRRDRPGAVLIYGYYLPENWILLWECRRLGIPVLFVGETIWLGSGWRKRLKQLVLPLFFRGVSRVVTLGVRNEGFYRMLGVPQRKLVPAKYSINLKFWHQDPSVTDATRKRIREELGIPANAFVLLFVGRLFSRKRPQDMVEIHRRLADKPELYTVMIGNGELEAELREAAKDQDRIRLVGFKNQGETRDFYYASDLLVVTSEFEFWPTVVSEAFATGLTAVVTDTCAVAGDLVLHNETGYIYRAGDVTTATRLVRQLIDDKRELRRLSANAHRKVGTAYDVEHFADALLGAFRASSSSRSA